MRRSQGKSSNLSPAGRHGLLMLATGLLWCLSCGCAAITNPVANGLPARRTPPDFAPDKPVRDARKTIPLTLLGQEAPDPYRLDTNDVLAVWIDGVLGIGTQNPPTAFPEKGRQPPAVGYPIQVLINGTVELPLVDPVPVRGLSVWEAQEAIRNAYIKKKILQPGQERIIVSLMRPRQYHVVVLRQESSGFQVTPEGIVGGTKRGTGHEVDLPAYENDVLHALAQTGGLPGLDAYNEVVIERQHKMLPVPLGGAVVPPPGPGPEVVKIPLRLGPDDKPCFDPQDVILHAGDVVFLEARDLDHFYTGGLLPPGQFVLPRDYDLDVVEAIALAHGPLVSGGLAVSNLSGAIVAPGIGGPSPSLLTILRRTAGGGQVPIKVDLNRALREPRERILVQPGDVLILQETPGEAFARYFTQNFFINGVFKIFLGEDGVASATVNNAPAIPFGTSSTAVVVPAAVTPR
jgi:protein involved in polysaccharide export with SLBB domain